MLHSDWAPTRQQALPRRVGSHRMPVPGPFIPANLPVIVPGLALLEYHAGISTGLHNNMCCCCGKQSLDDAPWSCKVPYPTYPTGKQPTSCLLGCFFRRCRMRCLTMLQVHAADASSCTPASQRSVRSRPAPLEQEAAACSAAAPLPVRPSKIQPCAQQLLLSLPCNILRLRLLWDALCR
jgi:hypothetical protein